MLWSRRRCDQDEMLFGNSMQYAVYSKTARGDTVVAASSEVNVDVDGRGSRGGGVCGMWYVVCASWEHSVVFVVDPGVRERVVLPTTTTTSFSTAEGRLRCPRIPGSKRVGWRGAAGRAGEEQLRGGSSARVHGYRRPRQELGPGGTSVLVRVANSPIAPENPPRAPLRMPPNIWEAGGSRSLVSALPVAAAL